VKVEILKATFWGEPLNVGDEIDIDNTIAQRWINKGIAKPLEEVPPSQKGTEGSADDNNKPLDEMSYNELRELAKENEIPGYSKMNKEALLGALQVHEIVAAETPSDNNPDAGDDVPPATT